MVSPPTTTPPLRKASSWRIMQIIIYLTAVAFSIGTLVGYKGLNSLFKQDMHMCILYATPQVTAKETPKDCEVSLEKSNNDNTCNFVYFYVISSVVYAIIGCWFFIACTSDAKTRPDETVIQSWKLVVPAIFFTLILTFVSVICSSLLSGGVAEFTKSFSLQSSVNECQQFKLFRPENATMFMNEVHLYRTVAELFTWLSTAVWLLAVIILTCRCCLAADFITTQSEVNSVLRKMSTFVEKIRKPSASAPDSKSPRPKKQQDLRSPGRIKHQTSPV
ncbi:uncharacterized protein LOC100898144 [Galendromus occidentalis]|uniref:Uncharacterized protein LOC100898144 n=1 Tax=Galendromus occidentalis TaxID=34638 RepID=A0AAJ6VZU0_9ACAR|nr:uncharacterized protein LOC100898144 [Galendromus occidentalis]